MIMSHSSHTMVEGFSVLLATYNDGFLLPHFFKSLLRQKKLTLPIEVLVVDNGSTDNTKEVCEEYIKELKNQNINAQYFHTTERGKSRAIQMAYKASKYRWLVLTDSDGHFEDDYFYNLEQLTSTGKYTALCGPYHPSFHENSPPDWFKPEYNRRGYGEGVFKLNDLQLASGINMVIERNLFEKSGGVNEQINYTGSNAGRGFDSEMNFRLSNYSGGNPFTYSSNLVVYHYTRPQYYSIGFRIKWCWSNSKVMANILHKPTVFSNIKIVIGTLLKILTDTFLFATRLKFRKEYPRFGNFYIEHLNSYVSNLFVAYRQIFK